MCKCKKNSEKKCRCGKVHCWLCALLVCTVAAMLCYVCHSKCGSCSGNTAVTDSTAVCGAVENYKGGK